MLDIAVDGFEQRQEFVPEGVVVVRAAEPAGVAELDELDAAHLALPVGRVGGDFGFGRGRLVGLRGRLVQVLFRAVLAEVQLLELVVGQHFGDVQRRLLRAPLALHGGHTAGPGVGRRILPGPGPDRKGAGAAPPSGPSVEAEGGWPRRDSVSLAGRRGRAGGPPGGPLGEPGGPLLVGRLHVSLRPRAVGDERGGPVAGVGVGRPGREPVVGGRLLGQGDGRVQGHVPDLDGRRRAAVGPGDEGDGGGVGERGLDGRQQVGRPGLADGLQAEGFVGRRGVGPACQLDPEAADGGRPEGRVPGDRHGPRRRLRGRPGVQPPRPEPGVGGPELALALERLDPVGEEEVRRGVVLVPVGCRVQRGGQGFGEHQQRHLGRAGRPGAGQRRAGPAGDGDVGPAARQRGVQLGRRLVQGGQDRGVGRDGGGGGEQLAGRPIRPDDGPERRPPGQLVVVPAGRVGDERGRPGGRLGRRRRRPQLGRPAAHLGVRVGRRRGQRPGRQPAHPGQLGGRLLAFLIRLAAEPFDERLGPPDDGRRDGQRRRVGRRRAEGGGGGERERHGGHPVLP